MSYEEHFSTDWETLTRDEAMVRAFVLGIDAERGDDHPEELDRLRNADTRAYIEMAYNAGRRKYLDVQEEAATDQDQDETEDDLPTATTADIVSELISRPDEPAAETAPPGRSRVDVPAMLEEFDFLDSRPDEQERLGLPDFLQG